MVARRLLASHKPAYSSLDVVLYLSFFSEFVSGSAAKVNNQENKHTKIDPPLWRGKGFAMFMGASNTYKFEHTSWTMCVRSKREPCSTSDLLLHII